MRTLFPHLWYDRDAPEAAEFYVRAFGAGEAAGADGSRLSGVSSLHGTPSGDVDLVSFALRGREFQAISAGPFFKFNPSISFLVACRSGEEVDRLVGLLGEGGGALMPLGEYPFSPRYAWITDRYGLSWQLMHMGDREIREEIVPTLMFTGANAGRAEEAIRFYVSLFPDSELLSIERYGPGAAPDAEGTVMHARFRLGGREFAAMDSAYDHGFAFNEAISLVATCDDQAELDRYWSALSRTPEAERCGWLKDPYGLSWQIVPRRLGELLADGDPARIERVTTAFLAMKKFDIAALERAARG